MKTLKSKLLLIILVILFLLSVNVSFASGNQSYKVYINGMPVNTKVLLKNSTMYFQFDSLAKKLGWSVSYKKYFSSKWYIEMRKGNYSSTFFSDAYNISVHTPFNGTSNVDIWSTKLDKPIIIYKNTLYVPPKFVEGVFKVEIVKKTNVISLKQKKENTLLVYMVASDLESEPIPGATTGAATDDLNEMMSIGSTNRVNVIVETGGTKKWNNNFIKGTSVKRWYVKKNSIKLLSDIGNKSMGDPKTLEDFIKWGINNYPAERYTLVLWNHGGGPLVGYGFDELNEDGLTLNELATAFRNAYQATKKKFTTVIFDSCLMGTLETANMLTPYASYMIASQIEVPNHGMDYNEVISLLDKYLRFGSDSSFDRIFGGQLVYAFENYAKNHGTQDMIELSLIDLSQIKKFMPLFNKFFEKLSKDMDINPLLHYDVAVARADVHLGRSEEITGNGFDLVDIKSLLAQLNLVTQQRYSRDIEELREELDKCINPLIIGKNTASLKGISIYMPYTQIGDEGYLTNYYETYKNLGFSKEYTAFIEKYYNKLMNDDGKINLVKAPQAGRFDTYYKASDSIEEFQIDTDSINKISKVYSVLEVYNSDTGQNIIAAKGDSYFFRDSGKVSGKFNIYKINNNLISAFFIGHPDTSGSELYITPIMLNGMEANLYILKSGYDKYQIVGAEYIGTNESGMASRRTVTLNDTDMIEPLFVVRDQNGQQSLIRSNNSFTLGNGQVEAIPVWEYDGSVELYYDIILFSQKVLETEHVIIEKTNSN